MRLTGGGGAQLSVANTWRARQILDSIDGSTGGLRFTDSSAPAQTAYWDMRAHNTVFSGVNDFTLGLLYNQDPVFPSQRVDNAQPGFSWNWEPYYKDGAGGQGLLEHNWSYVSIDGTVSFRPHSFSLNLVTHVPDWNYMGTIHVQHRSNGNYALAITPLSTGAGGSSIFGGQLTVNGTSGLSNFLGVAGDIGNTSPLVGIFPSVMYSGGSALQISASGTLTGSYDAISISASASSILETFIKNNHASGNVSQFMWAGGTGDAYTRWLGGSVDWYAGADNSAAVWTLGRGVPGTNNAITVSSTVATFLVGVTVPGSTTAALTSTATFTSGAGAQVGTITNAPTAGNPTSWIKIVDNGTTRYVPAW